MDSTLTRFARLLAAALLAAPTLALSFNHDTVARPISPGRFAVACSNIEQDASRIAPGLNASDYWEGRAGTYITQILAQPNTALVYNAAVPDVRSLYPRRAGDLVPYVAIVCHPTPRSNTDPDYVLPDGSGRVPHMQPANTPPKLIETAEYLSSYGIEFSPPPPPGPMQLPMVVYSHGMGGSPIGKGYIDVMVQLAAQGYIVAAPFHGDTQFSPVRIEDLADFAYILVNFDRIVEMQLMRPLSLKAMNDMLLGSAYAPAIDRERIGGFGASLGGEAMVHLMGGRITATLGQHCADTVTDPRIKAAVGFVPYAGHRLLPAFCEGQSGAAAVNRPFLALSGTADATAPAGMMEQAVNRFQGSRYFVRMIDGQHELRPEDVGDLFTWTVTFLNAYLDVRVDSSAMARLIRMAGVQGGREEELAIDVHVPFANAPDETRALEFYHPVLDHYFVAAGQDEIVSLLTGGGGGGWQWTGQAFKVYPQRPSGTFASVAPVCRFYGALAGGPNSHFFTASAPECEFVKGAGGWFYEGIGFHILPVNAAGQCPSGYLAVQRAYNNGFVRNDSNHRFTTSDSTLREMGRRGWAMEGNVMCARP